MFSVFQIAAGGSPSPAFSESGTLPAGITFDGMTGFLSGTPQAGTGGVYDLTFTASNGIAPVTTQDFALTVNEAPTITSADNDTFTVGSAGTFSVMASGFPVPTFSESGTLPSGVLFDGATGSLSGTPAAGTGGVYDITITATNGVGPGATQDFTLAVDDVPVFTSSTAATFTAGSFGLLNVTAAGFPVPSLSEMGTLPNGVTFNGMTDVLSGTPVAGTAGTYDVTFTAHNGVGQDASQDFTLTVNEAPAITSSVATTFTAGSAGTFQVTASGSPTPTFTETGTLPSGITFDGTTGILSGTPAAGTGGIYDILFTADNGVGQDDNQDFTLIVNVPLAITSNADATFTEGRFATFQVTAAGIPVPSLSESGTLPVGVTFDGTTGLLIGTPIAGSAGTYPVSFTAANAAGSNVTQNFVLTVDVAPPVADSADPVLQMPGPGGLSPLLYLEGGDLSKWFVTATGSSLPAPTQGSVPSTFTLDLTNGGTTQQEVVTEQYALQEASGTFTLVEQVAVSFTQQWTASGGANSSAFSGQDNLTLTATGSYDGSNFQVTNSVLTETGQENFQFGQTAPDNSSILAESGMDSFTLNGSGPGLRLDRFSLTKTGNETYTQTPITAGATQAAGGDQLTVQTQALDVGGSSDVGTFGADGTVLTSVSLSRIGWETTNLTQDTNPDVFGGEDSGTSVAVDSWQTFVLSDSSLDVGTALHEDKAVLDKTGSESYQLTEPAVAPDGFIPSIAGSDSFHLHGVTAEADGDFQLSSSALAGNADAVAFLGAANFDAEGSFSLSSMTLDKSGSESYQLDETQDGTNAQGLLAAGSASSYHQREQGFGSFGTHLESIDGGGDFTMVNGSDSLSVQGNLNFQVTSVNRTGTGPFQLDESATQAAGGSGDTSASSSIFHATGTESFTRDLLEVESHGDLSVDGTDPDLGSLQASGDVSLGSESLWESGSETFHTSSTASQLSVGTGTTSSQSSQVDSTGSDVFSRYAEAVSVVSGTSAAAADFSMTEDGYSFAAAGSFQMTEADQRSGNETYTQTELTTQTWHTVKDNLGSTEDGDFVSLQQRTGSDGFTLQQVSVLNTSAFDDLQITSYDSIQNGSEHVQLLYSDETIDDHTVTIVGNPYTTTTFNTTQDSSKNVHMTRDGNTTFNLHEFGGDDGTGFTSTSILAQSGSETSESDQVSSQVYASEYSPDNGYTDVGNYSASELHVGGDSFTSLETIVDEPLDGEDDSQRLVTVTATRQQLAYDAMTLLSHAYDLKVQQPPSGYAIINDSGQIATIADLIETGFSTSGTDATTVTINGVLAVATVTLDQTGNQDFHLDNTTDQIADGYLPFIPTSLSLPSLTLQDEQQVLNKDGHVQYTQHLDGDATLDGNVSFNLLDPLDNLLTYSLTDSARHEIGNESYTLTDNCLAKNVNPFSASGYQNTTTQTATVKVGHDQYTSDALGTSYQDVLSVTTTLVKTGAETLALNQLTTNDGPGVWPNGQPVSVPLPANNSDTWHNSLSLLRNGADSFTLNQTDVDGFLTAYTLNERGSDTYTLLNLGSEQVHTDSNIPAPYSDSISDTTTTFGQFTGGSDSFTLTLSGQSVQPTTGPAYFAVTSLVYHEGLKEAGTAPRHRRHHRRITPDNLGNYQTSTNTATSLGVVRDGYTLDETEHTDISNPSSPQRLIDSLHVTGYGGRVAGAVQTGSLVWQQIGVDGSGNTVAEEDGHNSSLLTTLDKDSYTFNATYSDTTAGGQSGAYSLSETGSEAFRFGSDAYKHWWDPNAGNQTDTATLSDVGFETLSLSDGGSNGTTALRSGQDTYASLEAFTGPQGTSPPRSHNGQLTYQNVQAGSNYDATNDGWDTDSLGTSASDDPQIHVQLGPVVSAAVAGGDASPSWAQLLHDGPQQPANGRAVVGHSGYQPERGVAVCGGGVGRAGTQLRCPDSAAVVQPSHPGRTPEHHRAAGPVYAAGGAAAAARVGGLVVGVELLWRPGGRTHRRPLQ